MKKDRRHRQHYAIFVSHYGATPSGGPYRGFQIKNLKATGLRYAPDLAQAKQKTLI